MKRGKWNWCGGEMEDSELFNGKLDYTLSGKDDTADTPCEQAQGPLGRTQWLKVFSSSLAPVSATLSRLKVNKRASYKGTNKDINDTAQDMYMLIPVP